MRDQTAAMDGRLYGTAVSPFDMAGGDARAVPAMAVRAAEMLDWAAVSAFANRAFSLAISDA